MEKHRAPSAQSHADGLPPRGVQVCCVFWRALTVEIVLELRVISDWLFVSLGLLHSACSGSSSRWTRRRPRPSEVHRQTHTHTLHVQTGQQRLQSCPHRPSAGVAQGCKKLGSGYPAKISTYIYPLTTHSMMGCPDESFQNDLACLFKLAWNGSFKSLFLPIVKHV